jgi:hypothetical protein
LTLSSLSAALLFDTDLLGEEAGVVGLNGAKRSSIVNCSWWEDDADKVRLDRRWVGGTHALSFFVLLRRRLPGLP